MKTYCHECDSENECCFPFKPTRLCEDKDKLWSKQKRDKYEAYRKEEKEAEISLEMPYKAV